MSRAELYLVSMTQRVGSKGQVVIPKDLRDRLGLHPGTEVDFSLDGERVVIAARQQTVALGGRFAASGMAARLLADRGREPR
jgi:AbrB family looped-hinge helix DNA binding protein